MQLRKKKRTVPELNTTSTADISFMLLIFFLVTTSMEVDKGMPRQLPPVDPDTHEQVNVDRAKVMTLYLKNDGKLEIDDPSGYMEGKQTVYALPFSDADAKTFRKGVKEFIMVVGKEHIIEIHSERDASYETYFSLQNEIVRSYRELRKAIGTDMPQRIQEVAE